MAHESFEDEDTAEILNEYFVSVKVDREERPDVDNIYMTACQMTTGGGGWPLSAFLTCDRKPFFLGTYFPKKPGRGLRTFKDILMDIVSLWAKNPEKIYLACDGITNGLIESNSETTDGGLNVQNRTTGAFNLYKKYFDPVYGGMKGAPKFPTPHNICYLLRFFHSNDEPEALRMAEKTLTAMYEGGIYDHVGFGFCRYSTDAQWLVPHFEKMLYDNALLIIAYTEAYQITSNQLYKRVVGETVEFLTRDMLSAEGGFFTAIDADSEGEEGKWYVWSEPEIIEALGQKKGQEFCTAYGVTKNGNFEGKNILNLISREHVDFSEEKKKLLEVRGRRPQPYKDDKILTGQNGMVIAALSIAGRVLQQQKYLDVAGKSIKFVNERLTRNDGRLLARFRNGEAGILAYAEDYAYFIWGLLEFYRAASDKESLERAEELNNELIRLFWDQEAGGLFLTGGDGEKLLIRSKDFYDGATPSANSVCANNFITLASITGNMKLVEMAEKIIGKLTSESGLGQTHMLSAALYSEKMCSIKLCGDDGNVDYTEIKKFLNETYHPFTTITFEHALTTQAYVCGDNKCYPPVSGLEKLNELLRHIEIK